jgi:hypothetical protein
MIDVVEEALDVEVEYPIVTPALAACSAQGIVCRAPWPVAIRVRMEHRLQQRFEPALDNHLCNSVRHRGDAQRPCLAIALRNVNALDRRREVAARGHAIPDPVQVLVQILLEHGDRDPVATSRATVGLDALVRLPHFALGDFKRLCFNHARHPLAGCARSEAERRRPFGPVPLQDLQPYYERLRPCAPHRYARPCGGCPLELLPWHRDDRFPRSSLKPEPESRRLHAGRRSSSRQASLDLHPGLTTLARFRRHLNTLRHHNDGSLAFVSLVRT